VAGKWKAKVEEEEEEEEEELIKECAECIL
jgi:hypothetical protein